MHCFSSEKQQASFHHRISYYFSHKVIFQGKTQQINPLLYLTHVMYQIKPNTLVKH